MLEYRIKKILVEIAEEAYPDNDFSNFKYTIENKERKTIHGYYDPNKNLIKIFNLSRDSTFIVKTSIHELAHHVDFCIRKKSDHSKEFYSVYKKLLESAIVLGYVDQNKVTLDETSNDINMMQKYFGPISICSSLIKERNEQIKVIKVFNSFAIKEKLKLRNYSFDKISAAWCLEIGVDKLDEELKEIKLLTSDTNIKIENYTDLEVEAKAKVIVTDCYEYKDQLKERGYKYSVYNTPKNSWSKTMLRKDINGEVLYLKKYKNIKVVVK